MKIAVVVFPGSNCDVDLYEALHSVSMQMWSMFLTGKKV